MKSNNRKRIFDRHSHTSANLKHYLMSSAMYQCFGDGPFIYRLNDNGLGPSLLNQVSSGKKNRIAKIVNIKLWMCNLVIKIVIINLKKIHLCQLRRSTGASSLRLIIQSHPRVIQILVYYHSNWLFISAVCALNSYGCIVAVPLFVESRDPVTLTRITRYNSKCNGTPL